MKLSTIGLLVATFSLSGCNLFRSNSDVKGNMDQGDQSGNRGGDGGGNNGGVGNCTSVKVLSGVEELGKWRMPHSDQVGDLDVSKQDTSEMVFDLKKTTIMFVPSREASFVYLANGKIPSNFETFNDRMTWLATNYAIPLKIEKNSSPDDDCSGDLLTWQGKQIGCFNSTKCTIVWIGEHKTGCELVAKDWQFSREEPFNCGELKAKPGMQPVKP